MPELKPCKECQKLVECLQTIVKYIQIMENININNEFIKVYAEDILEKWYENKQ